MIEEIVGSQIRLLRKKRGWTQEYLAQQAGTAVQTISRAERGKALSIANIKRIGAALNVHALELFSSPGAGDIGSVEIRRVVEIMEQLDFTAQQAVRQLVEAALSLVSCGESGAGPKTDD